MYIYIYLEPFIASSNDFSICHDATAPMPSMYAKHAMACATACALECHGICHGICHGMSWHMQWHVIAWATAVAKACHGICHGMSWHMP